jgi:ADP-ribose pyrophosphatase YjhB (NUDIX family)
MQRMSHRRLDAMRRLQALARTGLYYCASEYDRERYQEIEQIAAGLLADGDAETEARLAELWGRETGYVTPKIEVRGAAFRDGRVLMVRERADGLWTLPGGWADVGEPPSVSVIREIEQESGFRSRVVALAALWDRELHSPGGLFHSWRAAFLCEITGGEARASYETDAVEFFDVANLPPMSLGRSTPAQVRRLQAHWLDRSLPTEFD